VVSVIRYRKHLQFGHSSTEFQIPLDVLSRPHQVDHARTGFGCVPQPLLRHYSRPTLQEYPYIPTNQDVSLGYYTLAMIKAFIARISGHQG
jgi:hypothetical protein